MKLKPLLLVLGAAATVYALALVLGGEQSVADVGQALISPAGLVAALLCLLNYLLRGLRWRAWMSHFERPLGVGEGLRIYLAGYTFTPTPGNVGEAVRGLLLTRQPLGAMQSVAIFGAERLADLLALVLLSLPALAWVLTHLLPGQNWLALAGVITLAALVSLAAAVVFLRRRPHLLGRFGWLQQAWACLSQRPLRWMALSLIAWAAQGLAMWLICRELAHAIDPVLASGFYALAMIGGALSLLPAGLGGMEAILSALLVGHGAALGAALGITVLVRLLTLWLAVLIGAIALLYSALIRKDISLR